MFYILQEDRRFLIDLWEDISNNEEIDPYSELDINLLENYNRFMMPDSDIPLIYYNDEYGLSGCAVLTPLEINNQESKILEHNARWVLHSVNIHIKKSSSISLHPTAINEIKNNFYSSLREGILKLLQSEYDKEIVVLSKDWDSHEDIMYFTGFIPKGDPYMTESGIIGLVSDIRDYQKNILFKLKHNQESIKVVYLKKKAI